MALTPPLSLSLPAVQRGEESPHSPLMAYKYQYNPAATDNVSLHDTARGRTAGSLTYRSSARSVEVSTSCTFHNNNHRRHYLAQG